MKRILAVALAALLSFSAMAATTIPSTLINWVSAPSAPSQTAKFVFAAPNATAGAPTFRLLVASDIPTLAPLASASPTGTWTFAARPTFNGNTPWDSANLATPASTSGALSQFAATTSSQLAAVLTDETGTGSVVLGTAPTINQPNIVGVTNGAAAATGSVGEPIEITGTATGLTTSTPTNLASQLLTPGVYDTQCSVQFAQAATTVVGQIVAGISSTSATYEGLGTRTSLVAAFTTGTVSQLISSPVVSRTLTTSTTVYCVGQAVFTTSTVTGQGFLKVRRVH